MGVSAFAYGSLQLRRVRAASLCDRFVGDRMVPKSIDLNQRTRDRAYSSTRSCSDCSRSNTA
jgi:hypothetical protein